jgi:hypothetical protein
MSGVPVPAVLEALRRMIQRADADMLSRIERTVAANDLKGPAMLPLLAPDIRARRRQLSVESSPARRRTA